jgi:hypothetical protein
MEGDVDFGFTEGCAHSLHPDPGEKVTMNGETVGQGGWNNPNDNATHHVL